MAAIRCRADRRRVATASLGAALLLSISGCSDPCSLVVGCETSRQVAVDGRVLTPSADAARGVSVRLVAEYADHVDSTMSSTDAEGTFALRMAASAQAPSRTSVRVIPTGRPGYLIPVANCQPVSVRGDACILAAVKPEPRFRGFLFHYRSDNSPVVDVKVTFVRTGGALLFQDGPPNTTPAPVDSLSVVTDRQIGFAFLFPPGVWAGSLDPVVGDLTLELPASAGGRTVQHGFSVSPVPYFFVEGVEVQLVGPVTLPPARGQ